MWFFYFQLTAVSKSTGPFYCKLHNIIIFSPSPTRILIKQILSSHQLIGFFFFATAVMIRQKSAALNRLSRGIGDMTSKQQQISWLNLPSKSHEDTRVENESWGRNVSVWFDLRRCAKKNCKYAKKTSAHRSSSFLKWSLDLSWCLLSMQLGFPSSRWDPKNVCCN